jgi:hypothetical protein
MSDKRCWACDCSQPDEARYCGDCGARIVPFESEEGPGLFSSTSDRYLAALIQVGSGPPYQSNLSDGLEEAIEQQIIADLRAAYVDLGLIAMYCPEFLRDSVDASRLQGFSAAHSEKLDEFEGLPDMMYVVLVGLLARHTDDDALEAAAAFYENEIEPL